MTKCVYLFKLVPAGNYSLGITAQAFAAYMQKGIVMNANLYATQNVHLKLANVQGEVVTVTADAELIDTTSAELGMTINEPSVSELPFARPRSLQSRRCCRRASSMATRPALHGSRTASHSRMSP